MKRNIKEERIGNDLSEYQKWVDYDMKKYGKISDITNGKIRKAGLSIVKDQYGDYEVIADRPIKEGLSDREWKTFVTELTKGLIKKGYDKEEANDIAIVRAKNLDDSWRQRWQGDILAQVRQELRLTEGRDTRTNESCNIRKNRKLKEAKTKEIIVLQGNYGYGWDDVCSYESNQWGEAKGDLNDYRENERDALHRLIRRRVPVNESLKESKELDRKLFMSLIKLGDNSWDGYSILNDGNFVKRIYADNDREAIRKFRDFLDKKNESCNARKNRNLTEKRWRYRLKNSRALRNAIDDNDPLAVCVELENSYQELCEASLIDEDDCDKWIEEVENLDPSYFDYEEEFDEEVNFLLDEFYDLCDNIGVLITL